MGELRVRSDSSIVVLAEGESLGFGRAAVTGASSKGWGYAGRFLELGPDAHLHRVWGEIVWIDRRWVVRALGDRDPIVVAAPRRSDIELPPCGGGARPAEFVITDGSVTLVLSSGRSSYLLECTTSAPVPAPSVSAPQEGERTTTLAEVIAESIGEQEFRVLWAMAREYRSGDVADPKPISYARVVRALGLRTEKQASGAIERLKERFAAAGLLPVDVTAERQREWMCRFAVRHRVFDRLIERFGPAPCE